jgi:hypothetical protein
MCFGGYAEFGLSLNAGSAIFHCAQGMKGYNMRYTPAIAGVTAHMTGQPVVAMNKVIVKALAHLKAFQFLTEFSEVRV